MGKISNYTRALVAKLQDVFVVDQTDNNVTTTKSVTVEQIGDTIAGTQVHSTLTTSDKTLIGAINEASSSGGVDELDELTDVTITSATLGDNLRSDGNGGWVNAKQVVEMTNAQWSAISDKATWRSNHKNTLLVLTDAPNLNATAKQISYEGSTATVWDKVEGLGVARSITPTSTKGTFSACYQSVIGDMVIVQGVFACSENISAGGGVAFTLPNGLKSGTNASNFLMYDNSAGVNIHVRLANNGDVTPVDSMTTHSYRFTFAYLK